MTVVSQNVSKDVADLYTGFDQREVGIGLQSGTYASADYAKKKTDKLILGSLNNVMYIGFEYDKEPLALPFYVENAYNTVLSYNLHYVPISIRQAMLKYIIDTNIARIQSNQPLMVDYHSLKSAIPESAAIVRRYKVTGTRVLNTIPLRDWPKAIQVRSGWENHYRKFM